MIPVMGSFRSAPGGARFQRVQVPNPPDSGKDIAEGKGVHREVESEYIINALDAETNLVVAQLPIPEKINEMGAIPKLLEILDITGSTVTIDAIGATEAILHRIQEKEGFFVQQIKKNCPATWQEIQDTFGKLGEEREELPFIRSIASSCQVRIPKETDENGNDVTQDKETFLKQGSRKSS